MSDEDDRLKSAFEEGREEGRKTAYLEATVRSHDKRLDAINGSIDRNARSVTGLSQTVDKRVSGLNDKIDALDDRLTAQLNEVLAELRTKKAIEEDRVVQLKRANDRQLNSRTFLIGIATVAVMLAGVIIALLESAHAFS